MSNKKIMIQWDYKDQPTLEKLKELEVFGIFVYEDPTMVGEDSYSFVFSKEELTPAQLKAYAKKENFG